MNRLKIVADENIPSVHRFFECFGDIKTYPGRNLTAEQVKEADILLIRSVTKVNEALLGDSNVKFVGTCTIGMDHLDTAYLQENNIAFANAPGCNADGVVQYDLAALAKVDPSWQARKVGVIGCGNVGGRLVKALQALGVECIAYDPLVSKNSNECLVELDEVLACDIICMHAPYTTSGPFPTHHMIDKKALGKMQSGAILLNAGRGGTIDNSALLEHLRSGSDLRVVLDVWESEPEVDVELMQYVKIASSHIAGYGFDGKLNGSAMIFSSLLDFLTENELLLSGKTKAGYQALCDELLRELKGASEDVSSGSVNDAVAKTYDVLADDARFRQAIQAASDSGASVAMAFDQLRKTYPKRRELNHFCAQSDDKTLQAKLQGIGFI